jgi:hypothetical protein
MKIFRKLRLRLLTEKRLPRYLIYAIGEIALVMIGILLALQVNNWNEERKERKIEKGILEDLRIEFRENLTDAQRVSDGNKRIFMAMSELQGLIASRNFDQNAADSLLFALFDWFDYTPKPGASNNLIYSGNLNLIRNEALRNLLTIWTGVNAELDDDEQLALSYSQQTIIPFMAENYPMSNLEQFDNLDMLYFYRGYSGNRNIVNPDVVDYNTEAFLTNPVLQSHLSVKKMYARHNIIECENVINACSAILELIDSELNTNQDTAGT